MIDFRNLHVGLTNRCRLECPECARTTKEGRYIQQMFDLDPEIFIKFLISCEPSDILFCGNWGDPIYSRNFVELVSELKHQVPNCRITVHTNGSGKTTEWWQQLVEAMGNNDILIFSIDGLPTNYFKYRVNSKWDDVKNAVTTVIKHKKKINKNIIVEWKYLVFSYNENDIETAYNISLDLGFDRFWLQNPIISNLDYTQWLRPTRNFEEVESLLEKLKNEKS